MMKRLAATGMLTLSVGAVLLGATPAMANDEPDGDSNNASIVGVQTCRAVEVNILIATIHNILGQTHEQGDCNTGSSLDDSGYKHSGDHGNGR
ncbi:hypothetical protein ACGFNU_38515 [Spirillospora sp. NPDC048911]|uniref:hypothetical protein n=1 Tax=Spirillospora sp. NPDC048911 TaxID=3364527 RepID=UPI003721EA8A